MKTIQFVKGEDSIELRGNQPNAVNFTMVIEEGDNSYVVEIPSFNIFFETDSEEKIEGVARKSFDSFFKYWLQQNGLEGFKKHLNDLGFRQKASLQKYFKGKVGEMKDVKTISRQNLVYRA